MRSLPHRLRLCLFSTLAFILPPAHLTAQQQPPTQPEPQPAEVTESSLDLSAESVQAQIKQVEAATDLPENVATELLSLYRQTLDQLTVAANWDAKIAEYQKGREEAPALLEETRRRIATLSGDGVPAPDLEVTPDTTLDDLGRKLAEAEAKLKSTQESAKRLAEEADRRSERRAVIPELIADANQRLANIAAEDGAPAAQGTSPRIAQARRLLQTARKRAVEKEIKAFDEELRFYNARSELLAARRDELKLLSSAAKAKAAALQELVTERRQADIQRQKQQAEQELQQAPRPIRELAEENAALAEERAELAGKLSEINARSGRIAELMNQLGKDHSFLKENVTEPGMAPITGPLLRELRTRLDALRGYEAQRRRDARVHARARLRQREIEDKRLGLVDLEARVTSVLESLTESEQGIRIARFENRVRELLESRREALTQLHKDLETYLTDLSQLLAAEYKLIKKIDEISQFVESHILWIRSAKPLYRAELPQAVDTTATVWTVLLGALLEDLRTYWLLYAACAIPILALLLARLRLVAILGGLSQKVARAATDSFAYTLAALGITVLLAAPWPLALAFLGWRLTASAEVTEPAVYAVGTAVGSGVVAAASALLAFMLLWHACRTRGLAESHFRSDTTALKRLRRNAYALALLGVPAVFVIEATERSAAAVWRDSVGRIAFIVLMAAMAVFALRVLHPQKGAIAQRFRRRTSDWIYRLRHVWVFGGILVPVALAITAAAGYYFTALHLSQRVIVTFYLLVVLLVSHALLIRWLFVAQRRLALAEAEKLRAAAEARAAEEKPADTPAVDETGLNLVQIGDQTRKLLRAVVTFGLVVGLWVIWAGTLPALNFLENVELWSYTVTVAAGEEGAGAAQSVVKYVTLASVALAVIFALTTMVLAKNIPGLLEVALLQRLPLDAGGRFAVTALVRYTITVVGVIVVFGTIGVGWSEVQWLAAAITVGLGFGLQEIFANFVSGLILLFERPIRIGDTVTVGDISGDVTRIRIRATTIRDWDRKELIIPNKEFVTGQVVNWTLSDPILRVIVPVGIAYGSDTSRAEELLYKVARANSHVLDDPAPRVLFLGFGDSSLNFELRAYVPCIEFLLQTKHELHMTIDAEFRKANIEIAFPQRDIHVRSIKAGLPVTLDGKSEGAAKSVDPSQISQAPRH